MLGLGCGGFTDTRLGHAGSCPSGRGRPIGIAGGGLALALKTSEAEDPVESFVLFVKILATLFECQDGKRLDHKLASFEMDASVWLA